MNNTQRLLIVAASTLFYAAASPAANSRQVLWIETKSQDEGRVKIAVTREIADAVLEADNEGSMHWSSHDHKNLITKEMVRDVLDGTKDVAEAEDSENGSTAKIYLGNVDLPRHDGGKGSVVFETYKNGERTFRMKLGEIEIEGSEKGEMGVAFSWKRLLPFLKKTGGAVYISNEREDSEIWLFLD
jgi:hypothetical protein